jgi:membrane dipeptidase
MLWTRRQFVQGGWAACLRACLGNVALRGVRRSSEELYERTISGDSLVYNEDYSAGIDAVGLDAIRASGMTYAFYDVSITPAGRAFDDCIRSVTAWNESVSRNPELLLRADTAADIQKAKQDGKHALVFLFQDAFPLEQDVSRIRLFHDLGVRILQLTHNSRNLVGDGYIDRGDGGLSDFGVQVVERMNEQRMLVDLSHCADRTTLDAIELSKRPCAFTHAGCRSLLSTPRNKTDAQIRALAEKGGVIGIFNMSCWLTGRDTPGVEDVIRHIDHAVKVAGIDHVGFGSDGPMAGVQRVSEELAGHREFFRNGGARMIYTRRPLHVRVPELNQARRLLNLADALAGKGYGESEIEKIIGGNFLRLFREVIG